MPFDLSLALNTFLPLAEAAYDLSKIPAGWKLISQIQTDHFGFVAKDESGRVCISIRGTEKPLEWIEDFDALPVPDRLGIVHQGFLIAWDKLRDSILAGVSSALSGAGTVTRLLITGHSLGAALAVLCAAEFAQAQPLMYTFAGPRVGFPDFADKYDTLVPETYRIVNKWDIVPHLPSLLEGFKHVGHGVQVDGGSTVDVHAAHSLQLSYGPGLRKLSPPIGKVA